MVVWLKLVGRIESLDSDTDKCLSMETTNLGTYLLSGRTSCFGSLKNSIQITIVDAEELFEIL